MRRARSQPPCARAINPPRRAPHPTPGNYQFAYDVDVTRDLEPPDDNLLIRVRPAPCTFGGTAQRSSEMHPSGYRPSTRSAAHAP